MKYTQKLVKGFVVFTVAMAMVASLRAETSEMIAKIVRIRGSARYSEGGGVWQNLKVGAELRQGAIIQTATDSAVDIVLSTFNPAVALQTGQVGFGEAGAAEYAPPANAHPDIIRIYEDTVLAIDRLVLTQTGADKVTDTELDLRAGRLIGDVNKISSASIFEIKIPNGVAGIRGTVFGCTAWGVVSCQNGALGIAYKTSGGNPKAETVEAGFEYDIRTEQLSPLSASFLKDFHDFPHGYFFFPVRIFFPFVPPECYFSSRVGLGLP